MPVFDYQCNQCKTTYDVYHKTREIEEDIVCPSCGSKEHKRLISAPAISMGGRSDSCSAEGGCGCSGGQCGLD